MVKTLIVMRHGKAMPPAQGQKDENRRLTEAGAKALEARLPRMLRLLETRGGAVQIWTSPAKRARQTAELLEKALRERHVLIENEIETHGCLWKQDIHGFLDELRASEAEVVFAVCHVPFAEDIVKELVGVAPPFCTGALCCMEIHRGDADARLLWFAQGPVSAHWDTLVQLQRTITQTAEAIEGRRTAFLANPKDVETIHRFRTKTRTLRSLIAFIKPWQNREQNVETQAILKEVVGYTSRLRELDVLEKHVRANPDSSPKVIAFCKKEAATERAEVLQILSSKRVARLFERAMLCAKSMTWKKRYVSFGLPADVVRARFDAMVESVQADLAVLQLSDAEQTHDVRKRAKRARYVAEFNGDVLGADAVDIAKSMNTHQDVLGDVCDARANIRLMSEFLRRDLPKPVAKEFAQMRAQNEVLLQNALKAAGAK